MSKCWGANGNFTTTYAWDALGNLESRTAGLGNGTRTESFTYDNLNRLLSSGVGGQSALAYTYDAIGNILNKPGVGAYAYDSANPTRLSTVTLNGSLDFMAARRSGGEHAALKKGVCLPFDRTAGYPQSGQSRKNRPGVAAERF
ncbi:MAG: hypothetical protein SGJ01_04850 [Gemmatimonadota bacterium]|nr:hypothetical protein [Gemmatimonadota bacterium]